MSYTRINTLGKSKEEWLALRRHGIGGSDAAVIAGLNPWSSPYRLWQDKRGALAPIEDNEAMRIGRDLEWYVARRFSEETGIKIIRYNAMLVSSEYPFARANIDRRLIGVRGGLECKTCSPFRADEFEDGLYPAEYYAQCLHYLAVTGWDVWYLAVLNFKPFFNVYEIRADDPQVQKDMTDLMELERRFWEDYVIPDIPPPIDGSQATKDTLCEVFSPSVDGCVDLSDYEELFAERVALKQQIKDLETEARRCDNEIMNVMGENQKGICGPWVSSWKENKKGTRVFTVRERKF